ncbi:transporter substrate-binding domain-containing protein [bacterium]|nr:transporter substrate-binding domain-containing protein [bacterium]
MINRFSFLLGIYSILLIGLLLACGDKKTPKIEQKEAKQKYDIETIKEKGVLRALIDYSSTSYFVYKGQPMGYEYELLETFANYIDVDLEVIPVKNLDDIITLLNTYQGDVIAANWTVTKERAKEVKFTQLNNLTEQVLIQRKPDGYQNMSKAKLNSLLLTSVTELAGKEVYVRKNSSFYSRLVNLSDEIGAEINIKTVDGDISTETLIEQVSKGEIDYTIADRNIARINTSFFNNIDISLSVSLKQRISWAVRKNSPELAAAIDEWLTEFKKTVEFKYLYQKYFKNIYSYRNRVISDFYSAKSGIISPFDDIIKDKTKAINWDWRLIAALIYQESQFDPSVVSWAGASGLMQLMPTTAQQFGIDSNSTNADQIEAGIKYLKYLDNELKEKVFDPNERIKFVLAAYNVGLGHIWDAMRLAEKYELDPMVWDGNVAEMLKNKSKPKYYKDPVVRHGYCRGREPYYYVKEVIERFKHYENVTDSINSK